MILIKLQVAKRAVVTILYASESGKARTVAKMVNRALARTVNPRVIDDVIVSTSHALLQVICLEDFDMVNDLRKCILIVCVIHRNVQQSRNS